MHFCYTFCYKLVRRTYIIFKDITLKFSSNPFSVPFSIPFSSPVGLLRCLEVVQVVYARGMDKTDLMKQL